MSTLSRILIPAVWTTLVAAGLGQALRYESTPGKAAATGRLCGAGRITFDQSRPTVVLFAHPDCPCTRASLQGLATLAAHQPGAARIVVAISGPGGSLNERAAREIPTATVVADPRGIEARRFGAATSGQTFVFAPDGRALFEGGLTELRGHFGPSAGIDALEDILGGRAPRVRSTPVFGCAIGNERNSL